MQKLRALLLATIFVAGNLVLPEVDIFLDHGLGTPRAEQAVHLERPGGCRDHAEHCVLGRLLSELRLQAPECGAALLRLEACAPTLLRFDSRVASDTTPSTYRSRAPPASLD
jgi:hypothetical protein